METLRNLLLIAILFAQSLGPSTAANYFTASESAPSEASLFGAVARQDPLETPLPADLTQPPLPSETATPLPSETPTPETSQTIEPTITPVASGSETATPTITPEASETVLPDLPPTEEFEVDENGGVIEANGGRVRIHFPQGAVRERLLLRFRKVRFEELPYALGGDPFEIVADRIRNRERVRRFDRQITIEYTYDPEKVIGDEQNLRLFYFDEDTQSWMPLAGSVDIENHLITAYSDHLTVFDFDIENWNPAFLPDIKNFQVSDFTGAATYSYPIELPPMPGGMPFSMSLNYSSQVVDEMTIGSQAGWVGIGWSLDPGSIRRDTHGTLDSAIMDDTLTLSLNGQSHTLYQDTSGNYHTEDESYLKILYDESEQVFTILDQIGNRYIFRDRASYLRYLESGTEYVTWLWVLNSVINAAGQELSFEYYKYREDTIYPGGGTVSVVKAVYPVSITYPNGRYKVLFNILDDRTDINNAWDDESKRTLYYKSRLDNIEIRHITGSGPGDFEQVRRYQLSYAGDGSIDRPDRIFPGYVYDKGGTILTLLRIQEFGSLNGSLPATDFFYEDMMHLSSATNGYGGEIAFTYEPWSDVSTSSSRDWTEEIGVGDNSCGDGTTEFWGPSGDPSNYCSGTNLIINSDHLARRDIPRSYVRPGAVYKIVAKDRNHGNGVTLGLQLSNVDFLYDVHKVHDVAGNYETLTAFAIMPANAVNSPKLIVKAGDTNVKLDKISYYILPTYYRVTAKTVTDAATDLVSTYAYRYDEAATNDENHSIPGDKPYTPKYGEYRGNAISEVVQPDGLVTTNWYYQDDELKGRPAVSLTRTERLHDTFDGFDDSTWSVDYSPATQSFSTERSGGDSALHLNGYGADITAQRHGDPETLLANGQAALVQFYFNDQERFELWLQGSTFKFGVCRADGGSALYLFGDTCITSGENAVPLLQGEQFMPGKWYSLLLVPDGEETIVWVWRQDRPEFQKFIRLNSGQDASWTFHALTEGNLALDEYSEGTLYSMTRSAYGREEIPIDPPRIDGVDTTDTHIAWVYPTGTISYNFDGGTIIATGERYEYRGEDQVRQDGVDGQYGNRTRTIAATYEYDGGWVEHPYRLTLNQYRPYDAGETYLVSLPARQAVYQCPGGSCSLGSISNLLAETLYLYDGNWDYNAPAWQGFLTGKRTMVEKANQIIPRYSDELYGYDAWGNQTRVTRFTGYGTREQLASQGEQSAFTCYGSYDRASGACGDDTYHTYPRAMVDALGNAVTVEYDYRLGLPSAEEGPNFYYQTTAWLPVRTEARYDQFGRLTKIWRPGDSETSPTIQIDYNAGATIYRVDITQKLNDAANAVTRKFYNGLGQLLETHSSATLSGSAGDACGSTGAQDCDVVVNYQYDAAGRVTHTSAPFAVSPTSNLAVFNGVKSWTVTSYDPLGRTLSVTPPDGNATTYAYAITQQTLYNGSGSADTSVFTTSLTNPRGSATYQHSDARGRLRLVQAPEGMNVFYAYDEADRLVEVKRSDAYLVSITYDAGGRKTGMSDPDMGAWEYRYDALGNLTRQKDARTCETELSYDPLNRVTLRSFDGPSEACRETEDARYYYDQQPEGIGQRTGMTDASGWTRWYYDARGQVTREERFINEVGRFVTAWSYDSAGRVTWMRYPGGNQGQVGEQVSYTYLQQGAVETVSGENSYLSAASYNASGQPTFQNLGGAITTARGYYSYASSNHRLASIVTGSLQNLAYSYDLGGNITQITDGAETQSFAYDALDRLTSASASGGQGDYSESYAYADGDDPLPGLLTEKGALSLSYADGAHPQAVTSDGSQSYTYDANGNQVTRGAQTLVYDAENHLVQASGIRYIYNGDGQMVRKVVSQEDQTVYIGQYVEAQFNATPPGAPTPRPTWTAQPATPTFVNTPTPTSTRTLTPTRTYTKTVAKTATPTKTRTVTVTRTVNPATYTATITRTITLTRTITNTPNPSSTVTVTRTAPPATKSATPTKTGTKTKTPTRTKTGSATATHTRTATLTRTATFTPTNTVAPPPPSIPAGQEWRFYYFAGSQRIAMRYKDSNSTNAYTFFLSDHLGSTTLTVLPNGVQAGRMLYKAFGEQRLSTGTTPTDYRYTGQLEQSSVGLYYYGARWYDSALGRFTQADTIIPQPGNPLDWDRYSYVRNSPVNYTDPNGHRACDDMNADGSCNALGTPEAQSLSSTNGILFSLPIGMDSWDYLQYFGATVFAHDQGGNWGYDSDCGGYHCGMDFGAPYGSPAYSMTYGTVVNFVTQESGGQNVIVLYDGYQIEYWNIIDIIVEIGSSLTPGQQIGGVGTHVGYNDGNSHVHLEVKTVSPSRPVGSIPDIRHNPLYLMTLSLQTVVLKKAETELFKLSDGVNFYWKNGPYDQPAVIGQVTESFWGVE